MSLQIPIIIAFSVACFIMLPIGMLIVGSFSAAEMGDPLVPSLKNYEKAFSDKYFLPSLYNTLAFGIGSTPMGLSLAMALAWIVVRTTTPLKRFAELLPIFPLFFPPMMDNIAWIFLIAPRGGLLNRFLQDVVGIPPMLNAFSLPAMIWVYGLAQVPLAYLIMSSAFVSLDPSMEESATMSGSGMFTTFRKVTFPLMMPALLSAGILALLASFKAFETPQLQGFPGGVYVYVSRIYAAMTVSRPPDMGLATAYSTILLIITLSAVTVYVRSMRRVEKFMVITGRGYRPRVMDIGRWRYAAMGLIIFYFVFAVFFPFLIVGLMSVMPYFSYSLLKENFLESLTLQNYMTIAQHPLITAGFLNSTMIGIASALMATFLAFITSYIVYRTKVAGRKALEFVGTMPIAFPGLVIGLALLWTFFYLPGRLYGTLIAVLLSLVVFKIPIALRAMSGSVIQLHHELEEASRVAGGGWGYTFRRVSFPLLKPAFAGTSIYIFLAAFREVGAVILLSGPGATVAAVALFNYYGTGQWMELAAGAMTYAAILSTIIIVTRYVFKIKIRL